MAKRGKYKSLTSKDVSEPISEATEKATEAAMAPSAAEEPMVKESVSPEVSPPAHVNAAYDAMPNEIEDAGAVFKLAFLDAERGRLQTQALLVKQEGDQNIKAMQLQYQTAINELQRQIREFDTKLKEHRDYIEQKYGIALRSYTYDDETGLLKKQIQTPESAGGKEKEVVNGD